MASYEYAKPDWHNPALKYKPDRSGFRRLMTDPMIGALCVRQARKGQVQAEAISPVKTGTYKASFRVRPSLVRVGSSDRAGAVLENTADHAIFVEAHFRVLRRVIDSIERG